MSDEIKLLLNAIISNQELARAEQEAIKSEILNFRKDVNARFNKSDEEINRRFNHLDGEMRAIRRHVDINERELDTTITRVEKLEQNASH